MKFRTLAVAAFLVAASSLFADTFNVDKVHSEATFQVRHMMSKVSGKFDDFSGKINVDRAKPSASSVEFTIKSASVPKLVHAAPRQANTRITHKFATAFRTATQI